MNIYETKIFPFINDFITKDFDSHRKDLYKNSSGKVLEIGIGSGSEEHFYPDSVTSIDGIDPNKGMLKKAEEINDSRLRLHLGSCEDLPFEDNHFDTIINFLVLCSVSNIDKSISEIKRVLKHKGKILFFEHIAPPKGTRHRRLLERIDPYWQIPACGCHLVRDTGIILKENGFKLEFIEFKKVPSKVIPIIRGIARVNS